MSVQVLEASVDQFEKDTYIRIGRLVEVQAGFAVAARGIGVALQLLTIYPAQLMLSRSR